MILSTVSSYQLLISGSILYHCLLTISFVIAAALSAAVIYSIHAVPVATLLAIIEFLSFIYHGCSFSCATAGSPNLFRYGLSSDSLVIGAILGWILLISDWVATCCHFPAAYLCMNSSLLPPANLQARLAIISACPIPWDCICCCKVAIFCICHWLNAFAPPARSFQLPPVFQPALACVPQTVPDELSIPLTSVPAQPPASASCHIADISDGTGPGDSPASGWSCGVSSWLLKYGTCGVPVASSYI